ncbi:hypothetical protein Micbo1qcDRAFT_212972 [Microdochium bolleyi]|uniref:Uncharacterized protein n=1 Tax=Microdochium bolleyi TaxID=196109 RepID=A0A136IX84_9PEZI|nr:hypothetical protein Micbo1qcDRAFT_212972 [Microdochium bolleyi]
MTTPEPPQNDFAKAVATGQAQNDAQAIFFIDFPADLAGAGQEKQARTQGSIRSWQAWSAVMAETKTQQNVDQGKLPADSGKGGFTRASYRAKVMDYLFRSSTWFAKTFDQGMSRHLRCPARDLHGELKKTVLEGFAVPNSAYDALETPLQTICDGLNASASASDNDMMYWIMMTRYQWQPIIEDSEAYIRVISCKPSQSAKDVAANTDPNRGLDLDLQYSVYDADFNSKIFDKIREKFDQRQIDLGLEYIKKNVTEIKIPA